MLEHKAIRHLALIFLSSFLCPLLTFPKEPWTALLLKCDILFLLLHFCVSCFLCLDFPLSLISFINVSYPPRPASSRLSQKKISTYSVFFENVVHASDSVIRMIIYVESHYYGTSSSLLFIFPVSSLTTSFPLHPSILLFSEPTTLFVTSFGRVLPLFPVSSLPR